MSTPPLVGRDLDLAVAREQLTRSEGRTPASLLVRGEAGMGSYTDAVPVDGAETVDVPRPSI